MPFSIGQGTVAGTAGTLLVTLPPGPCTVALASDTSSSATAWLGLQGSSGSVTVSNGYPLVAGGNVIIPRYAGQQADAIGAVCSGTATVGWIVTGP